MRPTHALVSRPRPQLDELADRLEAEGVPTVRLPAFRFEALAGAIPVDEAWRGADTRLLLFTSPRAVEYGLPKLGENLRDARVAAIGPATAHALEVEGLDPLLAPGPDYDSEALLSLLDDQVSPGAAVILAAPGGREALQRGLRERGWSVRLETVYRRVLLDPDPEEAARLEDAAHVVSFWTSASALRQVVEGLSAAARRRVEAGTAIVVSGRLAREARAQGFEDVRVSKGPGNDALLASFRALGT